MGNYVNYGYCWDTEKKLLHGGDLVERTYSIGKTSESWRSDKTQTITFIVTNDCNLRCKYCYITHKSADKIMDFKVAKDFIDYILSSESLDFSEAAIIDFIGGEPFLEVELIDKISDYFKLRAYELNHDWYWNYRISICTNGVTYSSKPVQDFILKNYGKISVSITVDGTKDKHDLQRVFPDGSGSYDAISKSIDLWISQFGGDTKVTFASDDLPLLKESIISLWNRGISTVNANVVFENVWKDKDYEIFENQLIELADYILDNELYDKGLICSLFSDTIGNPYEAEDFDKTYCGAGKMIAVAPSGEIFPCLRYYGHSLNNHKEWPVGTIKDGIDMERVRPFMLASTRLQSDEECLNCDIASGCAFCQGFNYDEADTPTNFHRAKYICKMHKARVRANNYYFTKLFNRYGIERPYSKKEGRKMYFLLTDDYISYCDYSNKNKFSIKMSEESVLDGLKYAHQNFFRPIFVHSKSSFDFVNDKEYEAYDILHIVLAKFIRGAQKSGIRRILPVYDKESIDADNFGIENVILNISAHELKYLNSCVEKLLHKISRINLNITDIDKNFDEELYAEELDKINENICHMNNRFGLIKEVSLITDRLYIKEHDNCMAGNKSFVLTPDEEIYTCCGMYSENLDLEVGNLSTGIVRKYDARLYEIKNSNLCRLCDAYQCKNCVYTNKLYSNEVNVSPSFYCRKSHIERMASKKLCDSLNIGDEEKREKIEEIDYLDPIDKFLEHTGQKLGYYSYKKS